MTDYKLYVGTVCRFCKKVEDFMNENNIDIPLVNINEDRSAMLELVEKGGKGKYLASTTMANTYTNLTI